MDLGALPSTIDFQGPNGATFYRATQLSYTYKGLKDFRFQASIEAPAVDGTTSSQFEIAQQRMPDFTASAQYSWNSSSHLRIGGIIRSMTYTSTKGTRLPASPDTVYKPQRPSTSVKMAGIRTSQLW